jgi:hypothetical protein
MLTKGISKPQNNGAGVIYTSEVSTVSMPGLLMVQH